MSESARFNMIEAQIRTNDVTDVRIHAALDAVARERFVPTRQAGPGLCRRAGGNRARAAICWIREASPKPCSWSEITADDKVLDVGCGTGYSSAVLGRLAAHRGGAGAGCRSGAHRQPACWKTRPMFR